jgi:hypothetical protein
MTCTALCLIVDSTSEAPGRFTATLAGGGVIVRGSRQPLVDGARELLARGLDPATLLTMRHQGKAYDSFKPAPIGEWAKWTYQEGEKRTLTRARWRPFADMRGTQKSGSDEVAATTLPDGRPNDSVVTPGDAP